MAYVRRLRRSISWRTEAAWDRVAQARVFTERQALARTTRTHVPTSRILCYHTVGMPKLGVNDVSLKRIERQLTAAKDAGYRFVPARELAAVDEAVPVADDRRLALTFDDGFTSIATTVAPLLRDLDIPWTAFIVSGFADDATRHHRDFLGWRQIARLAEDGVTIGAHSVSHPHFEDLPVRRVVAEVQGCRDRIRKRLGIDTTEFAIPFGQSGSWPGNAHAAALAAGYDTIYAQSVQRRPRGTVARTFVTKFDDDRVFAAALAGAFDRWEEWFKR